jgi:dienelactone hydrolase
MTTFKSGGEDIDLEIFQPSSSGKYPAIVIAYGTRGMTAPFGDAIRDFADKIAAEGYFVAIPYYFMRTKTVASTDFSGDLKVMLDFTKSKDSWIETIQDCVTHIANLSDFKKDQMGLLAFSLGGHLALRLAKSGYNPRINALVEFFAPVNQLPFNSLGVDIDQLPPVQIHHGTNDDVVDKSQSEKLVQELESVGKQKDIDYEVFYYKGEGHGFSSPSAILESTRRTIDYFKKHVK